MLRYGADINPVIRYYRGGALVIRLHDPRFGSQMILLQHTMPRHRPPTTGYARIAQADEENGYLDDSDEDETRNLSRTISATKSRYAPIQPTPHGQMHAGRDDSPPGRPRRGSVGRRRPRRSSSGVDIKAINARLERWAGEIASKFKIHKVRGKTDEEEQLEIQHSVFQAPEGVRPASAEMLDADYITDNQGDRMTKIDFDDVVESVRVAIELGVHPKMISQGSSGSYFARNSDGKVVGVFKPKDEEPYATRNPKWTKWIHRNLFPCFFGRECLIPNLSYVSEAAAYVLDNRLRTNLVPYTDIVYLSSKSFHYDFWERSNYYRKRKPLPAKVGSFQVFLKGFTDANIFLRDHPWPDQASSGFRSEDPARKKKKPWAETCRPGTAISDDDDDLPSEARSSTNEEETRGKFFWTKSLQQSFREELEKLVILDYIMRNTDRGLDNWMIRVNSQSQEVSIISEPPSTNGNASNRNAPTSARGNDASSKRANNTPYRQQEDMTASSRPQTPPESSKGPPISIGAIDNSLSWPWKHPDAVSLIKVSPYMELADRWTVAELPVWLAFPSSVFDRPAIQPKDTGPLPASFDIDALVEWDTNGVASSLLPGFGLSGNNVRQADSGDERPGLECSGNAQDV